LFRSLLSFNNIKTKTSNSKIYNPKSSNTETSNTKTSNQKSSNRNSWIAKNVYPQERVSRLFCSLQSINNIKSKTLNSKLRIHNNIKTHYIETKIIQLFRPLYL
jgi:hypothetical protein